MDHIGKIYSILVQATNKLGPEEQADFLTWLWEYAGISNLGPALFAWLESLPPNELMVQFVILSRELGRHKAKSQLLSFGTITYED